MEQLVGQRSLNPGLHLVSLPGRVRDEAEASTNSINSRLDSLSPRLSEDHLCFNGEPARDPGARNYEAALRGLFQHTTLKQNKVWARREPFHSALPLRRKWRKQAPCQPKSQVLICKTSELGWQVQESLTPCLSHFRPRASWRQQGRSRQPGRKFAPQL